MDQWEKDIRKKRDMNPLIINRPEVLKKSRRGIEISLTTIGWIIWVFICRPLLIVLLWLLSFRVFFRHMVDLGGLKGLQDLKYFYITVIVIIVFIVRGWGHYNKARFSKKQRRRSVRGVSDKDLERFFKLPGGYAQKLKSINEIRVDFKEQGNIDIHDMRKSSSPSTSAYFKPS